MADMAFADLSGVRRLLLAGDWHGNLDHARQSVDRAVKREAQVVLQLGDFGYWEHTAAGVMFLDKLSQHAARRGVSIVFIDGNHDKISLLLSRYGNDVDEMGFVVVRPHIRYARRGLRWTWGGSRFLALGGAYSVDKQRRLAREAVAAARIAPHRSAPRIAQHRVVSHRPAARTQSTDTSGTFWFPEEQMTAAEFDAILDADRSPVDVIVAHDKPRATLPSLHRKNEPECWPNQDRMQRALETLRPAVFVHGHLHWRYTELVPHGDGRSTRVEGLGAEPTARDPRHRYPDGDSWLVLDLPAA